MRKILIYCLAMMVCSACSPASEPVPTTANQTLESQKSPDHLRELSLNKWTWMSDKNTDALSRLFDENSKFVHMSGTWGKTREIDIIDSGSIWYKNAKVHDTSIEITHNTGIVWHRLTLDAVVRDIEVSNEFAVTEVYVFKEGSWSLLALSFSNVRDEHQIEK